MVVYEIQLWYVIRDKIQSEIKLSQKKILGYFLGLNSSQISSAFFRVVSDKSMLIITKPLKAVYSYRNKITKLKAKWPK